MATTEQPLHRIGFKGWAIVCKGCGAEFGSAQREAMQHVRTAAADHKRAEAERKREAAWRARKWEREQLVQARRAWLFSWQTTSELAARYSLSKRHTLRWLHAQGPLRGAARRGRGNRLEWRAVVG